MGFDETACRWFHRLRARARRIEWDGGRSHVTARGQEREDIYREGSDRFHFLELLSRLGERFGVRVHALAQCIRRITAAPAAPGMIKSG
jgi:hypothetical protein